MKATIIFSLIFCSTYILAQETNRPRILKVWSDMTDTTSVEKLRKNKKGEILVLEQSYHDFRQDTILYIEEKFKKDKYWVLFRYLEISNRAFYTRYSDGKQYWFSQNGLIRYEDNYALDENIGPSLFYEYYSNGNIKFIAELKNDTIWNIVSYKFPNGENYNFGSFKNGTGMIKHLDDKGFPCIECTVEDNQIKEKILCD